MIVIYLGYRLVIWFTTACFVTLCYKNPAYFSFGMNSYKLRGHENRNTFEYLKTSAYRLGLFVFFTGPTMETANRRQSKEALEDPESGSTLGQVLRVTSLPQDPQPVMAKKAKKGYQWAGPSRPSWTLSRVSQKAWYPRKASRPRKRRKGPNRRVPWSGTNVALRLLPAGSVPWSLR